VIDGVHTLMYTEDADAARAFFRDVLGFDAVDAGDGWLIFGLPPGELACHPASEGRHELFLMCRDLAATMAELEAKGVEFTEPVTDEGWGVLTRLQIPGGRDIGLYEPRHASPIAAFDKP
jgi:catechol 2,3-dioxygenase-like lactoylglutathione lyase family enzyme